jgi:hypothetical protein
MQKSDLDGLGLSLAEVNRAVGIHRPENIVDAVRVCFSHHFNAGVRKPEAAHSRRKPQPKPKLMTQLQTTLRQLRFSGLMQTLDAARPRLDLACSQTVLGAKNKIVMDLPPQAGRF